MFGYFELIIMLPAFNRSTKFATVNSTLLKVLMTRFESTVNDRED